MVRIPDILRLARHRISMLRDTIAVVAANSTAAEPQTLAQSAQDLSDVIAQSEYDLGRVRRLLNHLGAHTMAEGASILCQSGRKHAARQLLALSQETQGVAAAQVDVALFLQECLNSLGAVASATARQSEGGRLIGSA